MAILKLTLTLAALASRGPCWPLGAEVTDALDDGERGLEAASALWVGNVLDAELEQWQEHGQKWCDVVGVLDELGEILRDDGALADDCVGALLESALQDRHGDTECGSRDGLHKGGSGERVDAVGHLLRLSNGLDEARDEWLKIDVVDTERGILERVCGLLLHLRTGIPHALGDDGDELRHEALDLAGELFRGLRDELEREHLGLPRLSVLSRAPLTSTSETKVVTAAAKLKMVFTSSRQPRGPPLPSCLRQVEG